MAGFTERDRQAFVQDMHRHPEYALAWAMPVGVLAPYAGAAAPPGWLMCDGSAVSRTTYAALYSVCGTSYGAGDGSTTFNLPDLRGRTVVGLDNMGGNDAGRLASANTLGTTGGSATSTASHTHSVDHDHGSVTSGGGSAHSHGPSTGTNFATTGYVAQVASGAAYAAVNDRTTTTSSESAHTHSVDLPNFTGTSGASSVGASDGNMPPFLSVNYIIKAA